MYVRKKEKTEVQRPEHVHDLKGKLILWQDNLQKLKIILEHRFSSSWAYQNASEIFLTKISKFFRQNTDFNS
jgi:hypothetical protein